MPSDSDKTSSILPAFLQTNFTHYLYIAFTNNNRQFNIDPYKSMDDIIQTYTQGTGTAFALECVNMLLMEGKPRAFSIYIKELFTQTGNYNWKPVKLIRRHFSMDRDSRVFFMWTRTTLTLIFRVTRWKYLLEPVLWSRHSPSPLPYQCLTVTHHPGMSSSGDSTIR